MPYRDRERAAKFYSTAFGWQTQMQGAEMGDYVLVTTAVTDARPDTSAGAINGGLFPFKPDWPAQYPSVVIGVEDVHAAMERKKSGRGSAWQTHGNSWRWAVRGFHRHRGKP